MLTQLDGGHAENVRSDLGPLMHTRLLCAALVPAVTLASSSKSAITKESP